MKKPTLSRRQFARLGLGSTVGLLLVSCAPQVGQQQGLLQSESTPSPTTGPTYIGDVENLQYNNPFNQPIDPAWYRGKQLFHLALNFSTQPPPFPIREQYLFVYQDEFQDPKTVQGFKSQPTVPGQFVVFNTAPGEPDYSPIWHNNWVVVPRSYVANTIKSVEQIMQSPYRIVDSPIYVN